MPKWAKYGPSGRIAPPLLHQDPGSSGAPMVFRLGSRSQASRWATKSVQVVALRVTSVVRAPAVCRKSRRCRTWIWTRPTRKQGRWASHPFRATEAGSHSRYRAQSHEIPKQKRSVHVLNRLPSLNLPSLNLLLTRTRLQPCTDPAKKQRDGMLSTAYFLVKIGYFVQEFLAMLRVAANGEHCDSHL